MPGDFLDLAQVHDRAASGSAPADRCAQPAKHGHIAPPPPAPPSSAFRRWRRKPDADENSWCRDDGMDNRRSSCGSMGSRPRLPAACKPVRPGRLETSTLLACLGSNLAPRSQPEIAEMSDSRMLSTTVSRHVPLKSMENRFQRYRTGSLSRLRGQRMDRWIDCGHRSMSPTHRLTTLQTKNLSI